MELAVRQFHWHEQFHGIPWNSMELEVRQFRLHEKFHRIPWNLECANFADTSSSVEFYIILKLSALMIPMVPLNNKKGSIEFHGTDTSSSMEFHRTWRASISLTRAVLSGAPISMTRAVPWNSMELRVRQFRWHEQFHGIPWNSMELEVRQFRWHEKFHGIPWNLECANFADTSSSMEFHGIPWN